MPTPSGAKEFWQYEYVTRNLSMGVWETKCLALDVRAEMGSPTESLTKCLEAATARLVREAPKHHEYDPSDLLPEFEPYYCNGDRELRVRVMFRDGSIKTGYVRKTTGWKPAYLLMAKKTSVGSSNVLSKGTVLLGIEDLEHTNRRMKYLSPDDWKKKHGNRSA